MRTSRGGVLMIVLVTLTLLTLFGGFVHTLLTQKRLTLRAEERRMQALWLARSAAQAQKEFQQDLTLEGDFVHVAAHREGTRWIGEAQFPIYGHAFVATDGNGSVERYARVPF